MPTPIRIRIRPRYPRCLSAALTGAAMLLLSAGAYALDVEDVRNLLRNNVGETIVLNMVSADGSLYITTEEAAELRSLGASETLIEALRPRATTVYPDPATATAAATVATVATVATAPDAAVPAAGTVITPVGVTVTSTYPALYEKEGWLSISNHDWQPYYVNIVRADKRIYLSRAPNGGALLSSGQNIIVNLDKDTYRTYGDSGEKLDVRVREDETTTLDLNPFGVVGNSGLTAVARDRDRVRSETLFHGYVPAPVIIHEPEPIIVHEPAPVIIVPAGPPVIYHRYGPPRYRPYYRRDRFHFGFDSW